MPTKQSILALFQEKCWFNIPASSLICSLLLSMFAKTNAVIITFQRTVSTFSIFCHVQRLVGDYGMNYWKTTATLLMASNLCRDNENMNFSEMLPRFLAQIASMHAALANVCQLFKVDVESIKKLADCEGEPTFDKYADTELIDQYTELFTKAVNFQ